MRNSDKWSEGMTLLSSFKIKLASAFIFTSILAVLLMHFGMTILAACSIMLGVGCLILISSKMMSRLKNIAELAEKIAAGNNEADIIFDTGDETPKQRNPEFSLEHASPCAAPDAGVPPQFYG
jgi:hypothetical protein